MSATQFQAQTSATVAHLTCLGSTKSELIEILAEYQAARDIDLLVGKAELGTTFATTQFFFEE